MVSKTVETPYTEGSSFRGNNFSRARRPLSIRRRSVPLPPLKTRIPAIRSMPNSPSPVSSDIRLRARKLKFLLAHRRSPPICNLENVTNRRQHWAPAGGIRPGERFWRGNVNMMMSTQRRKHVLLGWSRRCGWPAAAAAAAATAAVH